MAQVAAESASSRRLHGNLRNLHTRRRPRQGPRNPAPSPFHQSSSHSVPPHPRTCFQSLPRNSHTSSRPQLGLQSCQPRPPSQGLGPPLLSIASRAAAEFVGQRSGTPPTTVPVFPAQGDVGRLREPVGSGTTLQAEAAGWWVRLASCRKFSPPMLALLLGPELGSQEAVRAHAALWRCTHTQIPYNCSCC